HSNQARLMASSFSTISRSVVDCEIAFVDQTTYAEFIRPLSNPSCTYTFTIEPMGGTAVLDFPPAIANLFVDRQFGGTGANPPKEARVLTSIERKVMGKVVLRALSDLEAMWEQLLKVEISDVELETNPEFIHAAAPSGTVVLIGFEVNAQHASGLIKLCYPFEMLGPVLRYLGPGAPPPAEAASDAPKSDGPPAASEAEPESPAPISAEDSLEQIAARRPVDVAEVVQALLSEADGEEEGIPGAHQVSILVGCLPEDLASIVLGHCSPEEKHSIGQAASKLGDITASQRDDAYARIKERLVSGDYVVKGAADSARQVTEDTLMSGFSMLQHIPVGQLASLLSKEHPQTMALILSQLEADQAAHVLHRLPGDDLQADVSYRMATIEDISARVLRDLERSLVEDLRSAMVGWVTEIGGPKAVAQMLNRTGRTTEKEVLTRLDAQDPELAEEVRNQMFTFDDIARLTDREIQMMLREVDSKDLAIALKGASDETKQRIFGNMSEEVGTKIREEMDFSGPVRMSDAEEIQLGVVEIIRKLEEAGQITVPRGRSDEKWV
ncbi:MAG: FliG C-terminal domain-containing protein, partial [Candidatus Latescibacteria bacterium]|nr:FliG C-terminal domain-containing protein [Candidatus Latescibacterota bacterium]